MNLREIFKNDVAKTAFKVVDGNTRIIGKYGEVEIVGDAFDIYFTGPNREPLSTVRINKLEKLFSNRVDFHKLNGEGWCQTDDEELVRSSLPQLGVKKSRRLSGEALEAARERMRDIRKECTNIKGD